MKKIVLLLFITINLFAENLYILTVDIYGTKLNPKKGIHHRIKICSDQESIEFIKKKFFKNTNKNYKKNFKIKKTNNCNGKEYAKATLKNGKWYLTGGKLVKY